MGKEGKGMFAQGEGNQHPARNGKQATASWGLFSLGGEGGLCSSRGMGGRALALSIPRSVEKEVPGGGCFGFLFFCDIGFPALFRPLFVTSAAVEEGLELLLFIATYCPYQALEVPGAWN